MQSGKQTYYYYDVYYLFLYNAIAQLIVYSNFWYCYVTKVITGYLQ